MRGIGGGVVVHFSCFLKKKFLEEEEDHSWSHTSAFL